MLKLLEDFEKSEKICGTFLFGHPVILVVVCVLSRLDYVNATLAYLRACLVNHLQSILNAAARSIAGLRLSDHITDTLASFHWLRVPERIKFKLVVMVYRDLHGIAPQYLYDVRQYTADMPTRGRLRSSTAGDLDARPSRLVTVGRGLLIRHRCFETLEQFRKTFSLPPPWLAFVAILSWHVWHFSTLMDVCHSCLPHWSLKFFYLGHSNSIIIINYAM